MKAQRRHELKENDLSHAIETARNYLGENGKSLVTTILIAGVIGVAVLVFVQSRNTARDDRWRRRDELSFNDPQAGRESLSTLAALTQDADDTFVRSSLMEQGQNALRLAVAVDSPPDRQLNDTARGAFEELLKRYGKNPMAFGIAHLGLATVAENDFTLDGDVAHKDEAAQHLSAVIDAPSMDALPFKKIAVDRRSSLDATFTKITIAKPKPVPEDKANQEPAATVAPSTESPKPAAPKTPEPTSQDDSGGH